MSKIKKILTILITAFSLTIMDLSVYAIDYEFAISTNKNFVTKFNEFKAHYGIFLTIMMGLMTIMSMGIFLYHCFALASSGGNAQRRAMAMQNLLTTGICIAAQSSISLILALLFWGFFV